MAALLLAACNNGPPSCTERLVGVWENVQIDTWDKPGKSLNFVQVTQFNEDGTSTTLKAQVEDPEHPGVRDPGTPFFALIDQDWAAIPATDLTKADCQWAWGDAPPKPEDLKAGWRPLKFAGPDSFTDLDPQLVYNRVPPDKVPKHASK